MDDEFLERGEDRLRLCFYDSFLWLGTREPGHGGHRCPKRENDKFDCAVNGAAQQISAAVTFNLANRGKHLLLDVLNIVTRLFGLGTPSPHA